MSTTIKVKKLTELNSVDGDGSTLSAEDQFLVAHVLNETDPNNTRALYQAKNITYDYLRRMMCEYFLETTNFENRFNELSNKLTSELNERLENGMKDIDIFNSALYTKEDTITFSKLGTPTTDKIYWSTEEYSFNDDCVGYIHGIFPQIVGASNINGETIDLQIKNKNGGWDTICKKPLVNGTNSTVTLDYHGYFYSGVAIRIVAKSNNNAGTLTSDCFSNTFIKVLNAQNSKPFLSKSFNFWVDMNNKKEGTSTSIHKIVNDGFISYDGCYTAGKIASPTNPKVAGRTADDRWWTPSMYGILELSSLDSQGVTKTSQYPLGNTLGCIPFVSSPKTVLKDDFGGRYYYISADETHNPLIKLSSDILFNDTTTLTLRAGVKNSTKVSYTSYDEISTIIPEFETNNKSRLSDIADEFNRNSLIEFRHNGIGRSAYNNTKNDTISSFYGVMFGSTQKNMACLGVQTDGPVFIKEFYGKDINNPLYSFQDSSTMKYNATILKKYSDKDSAINGVDYTIQVLDSKNLKRISVNPANQYDLKTIDNTNVRIKELNSYDTKATLTNSYNIHPIYYGYGLTAVDFPNNSQTTERDLTIDKFAFCGCPRLQKIEIPASIKMNGYATFAQTDDTATSGNVLTTTKGVLSVDKPQFPPMLQSFTVKDDGNLTTLHIEEDPDDGIRKMIATFADCVSLTSVQLEKTDVERLGFATFYNCKNLTSIELPETVYSIRSSCFERCENLKTIYFNTKITDIYNEKNIAYSQNPFYKGATALTADNKYASGEYKYVLGNINDSTLQANGYNLFIKLPKAKSDYTTIEQISQDLSSVINKFGEYTNIRSFLMIKSYNKTPQGRRFFIVDKDKNHIFVNNSGTITTDQTNENRLTYNCAKMIDNFDNSKIYWNFHKDRLMNYSSGPQC